MLISRTSQYSIQALICIGLYSESQYASVRDLAQCLDVPAPYLAKILQALCRNGLLTSNRGRTGGFSLKSAAESVNLLQVLGVVEGEDFNSGCLLGLKECEDAAACPIHGEWKPIKEEILQMLESQTLAQLAAAVRNGEYRLSDIPDALIARMLGSATRDASRVPVADHG